MDASTEKTLTKELKIHAKAVGIPEGAAESFIAKIVPAVKKDVKGKSIITRDDLARYVSREAKKYNVDLAYVYKNHDKII